MGIIYTATTGAITVLVTPTFMERDSDPARDVYLWAYSVTIKNAGEIPVQLQSRYWHITDGNGCVEEVRGEGVVGEKPVINPGEQFNYSSGCPLKTPSGIMSGHYTMTCQSGDNLQVAIPAFSLDLPNQSRSLN